MSGGGTRWRATEAWGDGFRPWGRRRGPPRPEGFDAGGFEIVADPGHQRPFGPNHHEIDPLRLAKIDHRGMAGRIEPDQLGVPADPGVPRGAIEPADQRTIGALPGPRMLAPA